MNDPYLKKIVEFKYGNHKYKFYVSQSLFSSQNVDVGTQRLIRTLSHDNLGATPKKILDLGCGYGPLGIYFKKEFLGCIAHMIDRDALAVEYARKNCELNGTDDNNVYASLGFDGVTQKDFDLIVSNIPGKVGDSALTYLLSEPRFFLKPGGKVAVVVIDAIAEFVGRILKDPGYKITFQKAWPGHTVYHYEFTNLVSRVGSSRKPSFERGVYDRSKISFVSGGYANTMVTTFDIPEFDTLSYETELILNYLEDIPKQFLENTTVEVFNPGQGFVPVALFKLANPKKMILVDRDLLALETSKRNLTNNGFSKDQLLSFHQVGITPSVSEKISCIAGLLDEKDGLPIHLMFLSEAASLLAPKGLLIPVSGTTEITRLETAVHKEKYFEVLNRKRYKNKSVILLRRK